jgi:hypothetical protein
MSANAFNVGRVGRLIRLLASDRDGEALAACRALGRELAAAGLDFHDLADRIEQPPAVDRGPATPSGRRTRPGPTEPEPGRADRKAVAQWLLDHAKLSAKELVFVASLVAWRDRLLTEKQSAWFAEIVDRERARAYG